MATSSADLSLFLAVVTMLLVIVPMVLAPVTMFIAVVAVLIAAIGVVSVVLTIMGNVGIVVPVIPNKVDRLAAGVVLATMLTPVPFMSRPHGALTCGRRIYHISFGIAYRFIARVPRPLYADPTRSKHRRDLRRLPRSVDKVLGLYLCGCFDACLVQVAMQLRFRISTRGTKP
jgi:hypothetical protein